MKNGTTDQTEAAIRRSYPPQQHVQPRLQHTGVVPSPFRPLLADQEEAVSKLMELTKDRVSALDNSLTYSAPTNDEIHELRNVLTSIISSAQCLRRRITDERQYKYVDDIIRAAHRGALSLERLTPIATPASSAASRPAPGVATIALCPYRGTGPLTHISKELSP